MSMALADGIGLLGSTLFIIAYIYSNVAKRLNFIVFNLLNLVGAFLLIYSLTVHFNLAAMFLEVCWALIAIFGLVKAMRSQGV